MRRYLITTALPNADGVTQPGDLAGSLLPADVYARFLRARGEEVLFVSATGEHGASVELAAHETGLAVGDHCRRQHATQARFAEEFGLSFDVFGRSSGARVREQTQYFAKRLEEEGFLEARSTRQLFSPADGRLPGPTELLDARSAISSSRDLELRDSRQLYFLQTKLAGALRDWLSEKHDWPPLGLEQLDEGLEDRIATRDSRWGVPVPGQGREEKVYCAWFDAPIAWIGATREWAEAGGDPDAWRQWWRASEDVRYVQFAARDEIPFNAVSFPCMFIGSGEKWKLVDYLKAFHGLTYYGGGLALDGSSGGFMYRGLELLPADCWRYYLTANAPEAGDADFSWEALAVAVNEDLADGFGNFVHRSLAFADRHFGGAVPAGGEPGPPELELLEDLDRLLDAYTERMGALEFRDAIGELRRIWSRGNAYLDRKQPWVAIGSDREDAELTLRFCLNLASLFARLSAPTIPFTANRVLDALAVPDADRGWPSTFKGDELAPAHPFTVPPVLFGKVAAGDVARWRALFGTGPG